MAGKDLFAGLFDSPAKTKPVDILEFIDRVGNSVERKPPLKDGDRVRVSSINQFCPRFEAMRSQRGQVIEDRISSRLNRIFMVGRAFERYLRQAVFGPLGILVGAWECKPCGTRRGEPTRAGAVLQKPCPKCGGDMAYVEPQGYADPTRTKSDVGGSGDGFIHWEGEVCGLEVKTCKAEIFRGISIKRYPLPDHVAQTQVYMEIFGLRRSLIWYFNKNTAEQIAFWQGRDATVIGRQLAKGEAMKSYFRTGVLPERVCESSGCDRAKGCLLRSPCFESE